MANTTTAKTTWQQVAEEFARSFDTRRRDENDEDTQFVTLDESARGTWMQDAVYDAHGDELPDDWIYNVCENAAIHCAEYESEDDATEDAGTEFCDGQVDAYNADRLKWLSSNLNRAGMADQAAEDLGCENADIYDRIGYGQYEMASRILGCIARAITDEADRRDVETADDEAGQ